VPRTTAWARADTIRQFGDPLVPGAIIGGVVVAGLDEARIRPLCRQT
jgi:hypothetical protein